MKNNFFTHKLLLILSIFILIVSIFCTSCFASSVTFKDGLDYEHNLTLSDELSSRPYFAIFLYNSGSVNYLNYVCCDYEFIVHINKSNNNSKSIRVNGYADNILNYTGSDFNLANKSSGSMRTSSEVSAFCDELSTMTFNDLYIADYAVCNLGTVLDSGTCIYSNFTLKTSDGDVVFQGAPQVPEITQALVEQTTQLGMKPLEAIKVILPIVIIVIVGLIAFWKAWHLLLKQLRKA